MKKTALAAVVAALSLTATAAGAQSNDLRYGAWKVDVLDEFVDVFTQNKSKSQLGWMCARETGNCVHYLIGDTRCDPKGSGIPALVSSRLGAATIELKCQPFGKIFALVVKNYKLIESILEGGGQVGIVYALESGTFQVSRFETDQFKLAKSAANRIHSSTQGAVSARDVRL